MQHETTLLLDRTTAHDRHMTQIGSLDPQPRHELGETQTFDYMTDIDAHCAMFVMHAHCDGGATEIIVRHSWHRQQHPPAIEAGRADSDIILFGRHMCI